MVRICTWLLVALASLLAGCASLPAPEGRTPTTVLTDTADTRLGRAVGPEGAAHAHQTGIHALPDPRDAFAGRALLAAAADRTLDVQYYIWHADQVGFLLFEALWQAAERGVRVRLLLDDHGSGGLDPTLAALDAHPNLELRLYNPFVHRSARTVDFLTDFARVNRRMHNKSFTADNQLSIVGGRNVANEYFGTGQGVVFADLDVIAAGQAVRDVSNAFDLYWNSASAYPAASFVGLAGPDATAGLEARFRATRADPGSRAYLEAVRATPLIRDLLNRQLALEWTTATLVRDDPAKTLDTAARTDVLLFPELVRAMDRPEASLDLVSPYFVPGAEGTAALEALARRGVVVRILTNSMAASDEVAVHAGYAKRRLRLLQAGVRLYELKPGVESAGADGKVRLGSGASAALHAKTFAVDRRRIFVGSFNFDQRSALLNTEMGLVIDSPSLARKLAAFFDVDAPAVAYEVRLAPGGHDLEWIERTPTGEVRHLVEPGTRWYLRTGVEMLSLLPIEWLL